MGCDRNMCHSLYTFGVFFTNKVHMRQFSRKETNGIRVASNVKSLVMLEVYRMSVLGSWMGHSCTCSNVWS